MNRNSPSVGSPGRAGPETIIRSTAVGELVSQLLAAVGMIGGVVWLAFLWRAPIGIFLVISGIWLGMRSLGIGTRSRSTPLLTLALLSGTIAVMGAYLSDCPRWLTHGTASPGVFLFLLGVQLLIDLGDLWGQYSPRRGHWTQLQSRHWKSIALGAFLLLLGVYLVFIPAAASLWESFNPSKNRFDVLDDLTLAEHVRIRTTSFVVAGWFFALGATIGSYLNVVVYRLPLRKSLIFEPSSCPRCGTRIETRDNIPILGWFLLNGRCRHCLTPISARYPTVEFLTGSLFLLFYFVELISGGANLPVREPNQYAGVVWVIFYTKWDLIAYYFYHCFFLCVLWSWFLIAYDGNRVPTRSIFSMLALFLLAILFCPGLQLVPPTWGTRFGWMPSRVEGLATSITGGLAGGVLGSLVWWRLRPVDAHLPTFLLAACALTGIVLGWQAVLGTVLLSLLLMFAGRMVLPGTSLSLTARFMASLLLAAMLTLLFWRTTAVSLHRWWPGPRGDIVLGGLVFVTLLFLVETPARRNRQLALEETP